MNKRIVMTVATLFALLASPAFAREDPGVGTASEPLKVAPANPQLQQDLTGYWKGNDGGDYFIRQVRNEVWWYGRSPDKGGAWTNVFYGQRTGKVVSGVWADVPLGKNRGTGKIEVLLEGNRLVKRSATGGFGGSQWDFKK